MKRSDSLTLRYELKKLREGYDFVIGCDEVGRGCLAGPVVAAAVILNQESRSMNHGSWFHEVRDSKLLSPKRREVLDGVIRSRALAWGIGAVEPQVIDEVNIHHASLRAMRLAIENLLERVACENKISVDIALAKKFFVCVDGKFIIPKFPMKQEAVVDGDAKVLSIAAASIVAKVYRDRLMGEMDALYPAYGFARHKGYATFHHRKAIREYGLTPLHRITFCH